ncbi:MAG TPA: hypothetical protein EYQ86_09090, partial [Bacteroidetes bacterium]|nr:hypothetical protein [Bacteroidota bacterium]
MICDGSSYSFDGQSLSVAGTYYDTLIASNTCDSVVILDLSINSTYNNTISDGICNGDSYVLGAQTLTAAGIYTEVFTSADGCDSTVELTLSIISAYYDTVSAMICNGSSYTFDSQSLTSTGIYTALFTSAGGCDSNVLLQLGVNQVYNDSVSANICDGETYTLGAQSLSASGSYSEVFQSSDGCDSTVVVDLNVYPPVPTSANLTGADSAFVNDAEQYNIDQGSTFNWTVQGGTILSGSGSSSIIVLWNNAGADSVFVTVYDSNACLIGDFKMGVDVLMATGIKTFGSKDLNIYPNPFENTAIIEFPNSDNLSYKLSVFDIYGNVVRQIDHI